VEARKLLTQAEAVEELMAGLSADEAPIRLGTSPTIAEFVLPGPLVEFERRREHHLSVELIIANSVVVREMVREGRAEFGIAAVDAHEPPDPVLEELPFCEDEVIVAVPKRHPWAKAKEIGLDEFVVTPMIMRDPAANTRRVVQAALAGRDLSLAPPLAEVGSTSAAKATAISECAPVLLSSFAVGAEAEDLCAKRVRGVRFPRRFVLLLAGEQSLTPAARALIQHLQASVEPAAPRR
jgi:DNA-binding transcriptional LysR family regulator